jgi:hypothetical protein
MMSEEKRKQRSGPQSNKIPMPFDKAIEALLQVKPKKKTTRRKKKTDNK